jgi:hypothetical protein
MALRLRLERLLASGDLRPSGLPAGAVLVVRSVRRVASLASAQPSAAWVEALRAELGELARAAHPAARGLPPPDARAVLFADEAELLACLTRDLLAGRDAWYWAAIAPATAHAASGAALAAAWAARPRALPAALGLLTPHEARAAVVRLAPREALAIAHALAAAFALSTPPLAAGADQRPRELTPSPKVDVMSDRLEEQSAAAVSADAPPWSPWLDSGLAARLWPESHYLLGLAAALRHAPAVARGAPFVARAQSWLRAASAWERASPQEAVPPRSAGGIAAPGPTRAGQAAITVHLPATDRGLNTINPAAGDPGARPIPPTNAEVREHRSGPDRAPSAPDAVQPVADEQEVIAEGTDQETAGAQNVPLEGVETALGGALYLVNLCAWLELPGCWPGDALAAMGGWGIVEALARGLLGQFHARYRADPLWAALADLAGRAPGQILGEAAASTIEPPDAFCLSPRWLARFGPRGPHWLAAERGGRLLLADEASGCLIADVALAGRALADAAQAELTAYTARLPGLAWALGEVAVPPLNQDAASCMSAWVARWLECVLPFTRLLLARLLVEPALASGAPALGLLGVSGVLQVSRTHVDLRAGLDQISMALRRAGLDRDPGWVPDLGRIVLFHYD